jgi:heme exporter protein B
MWSDAMRIFRKDVAIELRTREIVFSVLTFSLLATVIIALGFYEDVGQVEIYGAGVIWVVVLFTCTLGLNRLFDAERQDDCLAGLLLTPCDTRSIYIGKVLFQLVVCSVMIVVTVPVIFLFFNMFQLTTPSGVLVIAMTLVLGIIGFSIVGTLFAAMLLNTRLREVLLPVVVYPLVTPVIIGGVQATRQVFNGDGFTDVSDWIGLMAAFDLIYGALCLFLFPKLIRE